MSYLVDISGAGIGNSDLSNVYTRSEADATFLNAPGGSMTGNLAMNDNEIRLRASNDNTHTIRYDSGIDGIEVCGSRSVQLATNITGNYITCQDDKISLVTNIYKMLLTQ